MQILLKSYVIKMMFFIFKGYVKKLIIKTDYDAFVLQRISVYSHESNTC